MILDRLLLSVIDSCTGLIDNASNRVVNQRIECTDERIESH